MVEQSKQISKNKQVTLKHFRLDEDHSFAQFSSEMTEAEYQVMLNGAEAAPVKRNLGAGKMLIICLDRSGSMSGSPMLGLRQGALSVGKSIFQADEKPFDKFITLTYDNRIEEFKGNNYDEYERFIQNTTARSMTNFVIVFERIIDIVTNAHDVNDLTVIFFTDGCDTCNQKDALGNNLDTMIDIVRSQADLTSRFLSIGFSANHDAPFMNKIANAGNSLGNFIFVDTQQEGYAERVKASLAESLEIAMEGNSVLKLVANNELFQYSKAFAPEFNYVLPDEDEEEVKGEAEPKPADPAVDRVSLTVQAVVLTAVIGETLQLAFVSSQRQEEVPCDIVNEHVEEPETAIRLKGNLLLANQQIFELIQNVQKQSIEERKDSFEKIKALDIHVEQLHQDTMKLKDRDLRREMADQVVDFKAKTAKIMEVLRASANSQISNAQIAQLNDVAYKAIRKQGAQKKLDERAIKNETFFKNMEKQLKKATSNLNLSELRTKYKDVVEEIGICPMSQCDAIEALEQGDCMCICLQISRSEATIQDPSKLVVQDILATFMSLDSFIDSSIFNLKKNQDASGGFDYKNQGNLALAIQGMPVSGVLPLFLFPEHWDIARRKFPQLLGFMCCLDVLGYAPSQYNIVPFLVLQKAIEKSIKEPTEFNLKIKNLVLGTCSNILANSDSLKSQVINDFNGFVANPASRTADVVASLPVLAMQLYAFSQLDEEQKKVKVVDPQATAADLALNPGQMETFVRFAVEEVMRRMQKKDAVPLSKANILSCLFPDLAKLKEETKHKRKIEVDEDAKKAESSGNKFAAFTPLAKELQAKMEMVDEDMQSAASSQHVQEESKDPVEGAPQEVQRVNYNQITNAVVAGKPWRHLLEDKSSQCSKLNSQATSHFNQYQGTFMRVLSELLQADKPIVNAEDVFKRQTELLFAVLLQNAMQPKNSHRTEAIKEGKYKELNTIEDADAFLTELLDVNMKTEMLGIESEVQNEIASLQQMEDVNMVLSAPDVYHAAAVLIQQKFFIGRGDRTAFFKVILSSDPKMFPDIARKIKLVTAQEFGGLKIFNDKLCHPERVNKQTVYQLWLHLARRHKVATVQQMIDFAPYRADLLQSYDKYVDENGKTTLNMDEYMKFRQEQADLKKQQDKKKKAKKGKKGKL